LQAGSFGDHHFPAVFVVLMGGPGQIALMLLMLKLLPLGFDHLLASNNTVIGLHDDSLAIWVDESTNCANFRYQKYPGYPF
jgi:hypothetical protein